MLPPRDPVPGEAEEAAGEATEDEALEEAEGEAEGEAAEEKAADEDALEEALEEALEDDEAAATDGARDDGARLVPVDATLFPNGLGATFQLCNVSLVLLRSSPDVATYAS
mmetsp:Transcript_29102/g.78031  ORF Transcript_29102/g.78031 Transcript_29102/m.78031 type:complete len:111 (-) Transcript_29102:872-1204(-)